ncbi:hypothetical protein [Paenibacillus sp. Marseille-Q7038]
MNALTQLTSAEVRGDIKIYAADPCWVNMDMGGPSTPRTAERAAELILRLVTMGMEEPSGS